MRATRAGGTTALWAEAAPDLRESFRFHSYRRLSGFAKPDLLLRGPQHPDSGTVGWMTAGDAVVLIEPGADGVVFLDRSTVLAESCLHRRPGLSRSGVQSRSGVHPHPGAVIELDIEVAVVFRPSWYNYFHWMTQCLPMALHSLEVHPDAEVVLPTHRSFAGRMVEPAFSEATYHRSLDVVLGTDRPTRFLEPGYYRFRSVHMPLFPQRSIFGHAFRERFFERFEEVLGPRSHRRTNGSTGSSRRIFIPRTGATNRNRVGDNVHSTMACLAEQAGYETLDLSTMNWLDQVQAFADASHVFAVHGAGLTNIIFANGATVIEYNERVGDETSLRDPYFTLCRELDLRYFLIRDVDLCEVEPDLLCL